MKRKKRKKYSSQKASESIRREREISEYGKHLSLRPSKVHESRKKYKRNKKVDIPDDSKETKQLKSDVVKAAAEHKKR